MQLGVTQRTIWNWESGRVRIPYSAYALLRISSGFAVPGAAWEGWSIRGDALYTPEGLAFRASELGYWSLTVAMAREWQRRPHEAASAPPGDCLQAASVVNVAECVTSNVIALPRRFAFVVSEAGERAEGGSVATPAAPEPATLIFGPVTAAVG